MRHRLSLAAPGMVALLSSALCGLAQNGDERKPEHTAAAPEIVSGWSVRNDVSPPLGESARVAFAMAAGSPSERFSLAGLMPASGHRDEPDTVVQSTFGALAMPAPILNFDGIPFPGVSCSCAPPSANGAVGATQYVQAVNEGFQVFNKTTGASVFGPSALSTLWAGFGGVCQSNGYGDPVVLYDQLANRWIVSQFAGTSIPTDVCVAVSTTSDATGAWHRYDFNLGPDFQDQPKIAVWPDAYYLSTNVYNITGPTYLGPRAMALDRAAMLAGGAAAFISFGPLSTGLGFMLPGNLDGSNLPPAGAPNPWLGILGATWPLYRFHVDWVTPANSTFTFAGNLTPAGFTELCPSTNVCVPQLGTTDKLATLGNYPMFRLAYRRFGDGHEALVGTRTVESGGVAGIRWWEIGNATSGSPAFTQQGTYAPDTTWRWMGSAAMDVTGNLAIGFSASDATINPQIRYAGRLASDPAGALSQGEATLFAGTGSQTGTSNRWGDYNSLTVDPVDECTFWYTNEYYTTTSAFNWRTRIGSFKFPACEIPTFTVAVSPATQGICTPSDGAYTVTIGSVSGFNHPVALSATGNPPGTTVSFSVNPVTPPGTSTMTIGNTGGVAAGSYTIDVQGQTVDPITMHGTAALNLYSSSPGAPTLLTPANAVGGQPLSPAFTWSAALQAATYTLEVATDAGFTGIVHTSGGLTGTSYSGATLISNTVYYWRVRAMNGCGTGSNSSAFVFATAGPPGSCPSGTAANIIYSEGFEAGGPGWTHSGTGDTWTLSTAQPHGGTHSFFAVNPATVSDQRLVSPSLALPVGNLPLVLGFWNWQHMETRTGGCYDGGILEVSTTGGTTWTQIDGASLLTDPYDGPVSESFGNPLAGLNAWCGNNPQPYLNSLVDIGSYAGQTVQFRFRMGSDSSLGMPGWYIDDVVIQNCVCSVSTPIVTAPAVVGAGSPNRTASVPNHPGFTYAWTIGNGTITAGQGTSQITFTAGTAGTPLTLGVTETNFSGCVSAPGSATVTVVPAGSAVLFYTVPPCRHLDTRSGSPIASFGTLTVALTGAPCGIPAGARSVSVNIAETLPVGSGHLRIYPADVTLPLISNLNFNSGKTRSNNAILRLSGDGTGRVKIYNSSGGTVHVIVDVNGYFQ